ncbi:MAG TPA: DUF2520 domain-containing protein, partial [Ignavibacteriaceae bacterium]
LKSKDIPASAAFPYLTATSENLMKDSDPLSGPVIRDDKKTINAHLKVLNNHPLKNVYISFLEAYDKMKKEKILENNK